MIRVDTACLAAKTVRGILRLMGKGATTLPGKTALKIDPLIIKRLARGKNIITITGTNGKTTTSHMISDMLNSLGYDVINNISGANLATGIATTLICGKDEIKKAQGKSKGTVYVLETDEAAFAKTAGQLSPKVCVVTNLFRDQLDRYGELTHTRDMIRKGIDDTDAVSVLNADDSLVASIGEGREEKAFFYGMNKDSMRENNVKYPPRRSVIPASPDAVYCPKCKVRYEYEARSFGHLGNFRCPSCGSRSPKDNISVIYDLSKSPSSEDYQITVRNEDIPSDIDMTLKIPGAHNIYNTCASISAVNVMLGELEKDASKEDIFERAVASQDKVEAAFGRMEKIKIGDRKICILLVKNPVGLESSLNLVAESDDAAGLMMLLSSNFADGKDVSWIWDVDIEAKAEDLPSEVAVSGQRYEDMRLRLTYAGLEVGEAGDMEKAKDILQGLLDKCPDGKCVYVLPNYTSMLALRAILVKEYGLKDFWK